MQETHSNDFCQPCFYAGNLQGSFEPTQNESAHFFCAHKPCPNPMWGNSESIPNYLATE